MKLNNRFIFGILSLLLAAVIAFVALPTIARQTNGKEQISSENAEVVEVGGYNLPSNIAHQLSDVNGLYATADLAVGDYILTSKISSVPVSSDVALNSIPSGKVAISLTVKTLASGLSDKLQPGDIIRIYHFLDTAAEVPELRFVKAPELRRELEYTGAIFQTTIDSEVIAYHIARERLKSKSVEEAVGRAMTKIKGAYSLVVMSPRKLIGARDPYGFKPLCIGKRDNAYFLSSETCALDTVGAEFVRDVLPGEIVTISPEKGIESDTTYVLKPAETARCIFEYIYFARPDSFIDGVSVYDSRILAGKFLAMDSPVDADLVIGVPESGNCAAMGYSMQSGIPYGMGFVKNAYVGRTFIKPKQKSRESSVQVKLNPIREAVEGKRVIMIDDSIVRGTTSDRIVKMLREAGAKEVHMRVSSPPFLWPCYFGTDVPARDQLIAYNRSIKEISDLIGTDSLDYLKIERLEELVGGNLGICKGCFTGKYPMEPPAEDIRGEFDK